MYFYGVELYHLLLPKLYPIVSVSICWVFFSKSDILLTTEGYVRFLANQ